jgi:hypothetical protein
MTKLQHDDEEEDLSDFQTDPRTGRKVLRDGGRYKVRLFDSMQKGIAKHFGSLHDGRLHDGHGGPPGHKPGFIVSDAHEADQEVARAYVDAERALTSAWQDSPSTGAGSNSPIGAHEGDICTCRGAEYPNDFGSAGHLRMQNDGTLVCVPDNPKSKDANTDPRQAALDAYDLEISQRWRGSDR